MREKKVRPISFGLVFLGLCFFANPYFSAIDLLPDCIGCLLICAGLFRAATVSVDMKEARQAFFKVALVDVCKNIGLFMVLGMGSAVDKPIVLLILAFSAAVLNMIFLVPAVRQLFLGFSTIANVYDCTDLYKNEEGGRNRTELIASATVAFLIYREVVCLLPEFASLSSTTNGFNETIWDVFYEYIGLMRAFAFIAVGFFSIVWICMLLWYYLHFRRQKALQQGLGERYAAYCDMHPGLAVERRHAVAFLFLMAGAVLLTDFYLDYQNVLPDVLAGILLLVGALIPAAEKKWRISAACMAVAYSVAAGISSHFAYQFVSQYQAADIDRSADAARSYLLMWVTSLGEFLIFLVLLVLILLVLRDTFFKWAGYRAHHAETDLEEEEALPKRYYLSEEDKLNVPDTAPDEQHQARFETRRLRRLRADFDRSLIRCFLFGFVSSMLSFLFDYIKTMPGDGIYHVLEFTWIFDFCAAVAFAVCFGLLLRYTYMQIQNRFRLDE